MKHTLDKAGIEIEGEFSSSAMNAIRPFGSMKGDGSLHPCGSNARTHPRENELYCREFVSSPFIPREKGKFDKIFDLLQSEYVRGQFHYNASMGFHVHTSYKGTDENTLPVEIWSKEFYSFFYSRLQRDLKGVLIRRKDNSFCVMRTDRSESDITYSQSRYHGINFSGAYERHRTIEFRIFPASSPNTMRRYFWFTINTVRDFLSKCERKNFPFSLVKSESVQVQNEPREETIQQLVPSYNHFFKRFPMVAKVDEYELMERGAICVS